MMNCNHEEADTRIVVHILHALHQGMKKIIKPILLTQILLSFLLVLSLSYPRLNLWQTSALHLA